MATLVYYPPGDLKKSKVKCSIKGLNSLFPASKISNFKLIMEQSKTNIKINASKDVTIHYKGDVAKLYNKNRTSSLKWKREQKIMEKIISNFSPKSIILDIPVGTGRLIPFYDSRSHKIYGIISPQICWQKQSKPKEQIQTLI